MINPFYGFGSRVSGNRLVGREAEVRRFASYLASHTGSLSIIGVGKIGKSSLTHAIVGRSMQDHTHVAYVWLTISTIPNPSDVYHSLVREIIDSCEQRSIPLPAAVERALREPETGDIYPAFKRCRRVLQALARAHINTLVVFDEFDAVKDYEQSKLFLQQVREFIDFREETGFVAVIVSRRSLYHLERQVSGISNLDGVCEKHFVRPLVPEALRLMCHRLEPDWALNNEQIEQIEEYSGGHPYLGEMALCRAWEPRDLATGIDESLGDLLSYFEHLRQLLLEDGIFEQMIQLAVGPIFQSNMEAVERLVRYGILILVKNSTSEYYRAWCEPFQLYLERTARETPLWPMWRDTETAVRWLVRSRCIDAYGEGWLNQLVAKHPGIKLMIHGSESTQQDGCQKRMLREQRNFGPNASDDVLDYTYPMDLWTMLSAEWPLFSATLQKDKFYWNEHFVLLAKVRTPTAHNREHGLPEHMLTTAKGYCQEVLTLIGNPSGSQ